jgi:exopolysaccharide biosynthesis polyprenyl glycosylphosphotransferase
VNATEQVVLLPGLDSDGELLDLVDGRTLEILKRRYETPSLHRRGWLVRRMLVCADLIGLALAMLAAEWIVNPHSASGTLDARDELIVFFATLPGWVVIAKLYGLYDRDEERTDHSTADDFAGVFHMVTVCTWVFTVGTYITGLAHPTAPKLVVFWGVAVALVTLARVGARGLSRRSIAYVQNTIIVGAGDVGQLVARKLLQHPEYGINVVGFVDSEPKERREDLEHLALLGEPERLPALIPLLDVERVIIAFSRESHEETIEMIRSLRGLDVQIDLVPRFFEIVGPRFDIHTVEGLPLVGLPPVKISRSSLCLKRTIDIFIAFLGLVVAAPLFALAAWRIRQESPGPVFFRQRRLGMGMREFTALKFRTMRADTDDAPHREYIRQTMSSAATPNGNGLYKLDRSDAVTPFGQWLRKTSLDELPQLINVLRGEMSLVGPRPCIPYETDSFKPHHFERFGVPAGITGLWQVTARAHSTFGEALDLDVAYARGWSLGLDLSLLLKTPAQMVRTKGTA